MHCIIHKLARKLSKVTIKNVKYDSSILFSVTTNTTSQMPSVQTQTECTYTVVDNCNDTEVMNNMRMFTSAYNRKPICIFFKYSRPSTSNVKSTMTSYNSQNVYYMDMYIQQLKDAGDW